MLSGTIHGSKRLARRLAATALYAGLDATGANRRAVRGSYSHLRVLAYHGVCPDSVRHEAWVPPFFVTESAFRRQMEHLRRRFQPVSLRAAVEFAAQNGHFEPGSVAVTLDDGYYNNLTLAGRILAEFAIPATVFLATRCVDEAQLLPHDRVRFIRLWRAAEGEPPIPELEHFTRETIGTVLEQLDSLWPRYEARVTPEQMEILRPMTWREVRSAPPRFDFGGHTHNHTILGNETREVRRWEILESMRRIREQGGHDAAVFSYPNGQEGDYDEGDKEVLRSIVCKAALSGIAGTNPAGADMLELRRLPVSLGHNSQAFHAELSGLRYKLLR
jgi:peptidoglycan/xylan/chitin deacetylase (PgdA/CDA1 family)